MPPVPVLHLFSLPAELLQSLTPRNLVTQEPAKPLPQELERQPDTQISTSLRTCNICRGVVFADVDDQRQHFHSDWHRYNVKARLSNGKTVTEAEFGSLIEGLEDSLSGSASSDDDDESESDAVQTLLSKTRIRSRSPSPSSIVTVPRSAIVWFHSPPSMQIGIYRTILSQGADISSYLGELKALQKGAPEGRRWAMFMVAGGHFAGVVVRVSRPDPEADAQQKGKQKPIPVMEILRHKTFHRYTTRRKQGGSQALNDNAKGNAKSAGATLRRYGEQALRDDIRNLLEEWAGDIDTCERIWIRASGANRKIFLDYDAAILRKGDERLRTFPFPTRRPTQSELQRCLMELTKVKVSNFTEDQLREQDQAYLASLPKPKPRPVIAPAEPRSPASKAPVLSKEELQLRERWTKLLDMVKKGRLEALKAYWEREGSGFGGVDALIPEWTGERGGTLLQLAAESGQGDMTAWLLDELHADPTVPVPMSIRTRASDVTDRNDGNESESSDAPSRAGSKVAYDLTSSRVVRDVFRRSAAARPEEWDWFGAAHVPSALSKEMEEERDSRKKVRRKGLRDKIREREAQEKEREQSPVRESSPEPVKAPPRGKECGPQKLGGAAAATVNASLAGLTPEMRAKIERERRARAAEARLKGIGAR